MANTGKPAKTAPKKPSRTRAKKIGADMRHRMIAEAAYYRAEQRGFAGDDGSLDPEVEFSRNELGADLRRDLAH